MPDSQGADRSSSTLETVQEMVDAVNRQDVDALMGLCTDDVIWETTTPPDGERYEGKAAVRAALEAFFHSSAEAHFETERQTSLGESAVLQWRYSWRSTDGTSGHVRGVDVIRVRDDKIAEMLAYVKG